MDRCEFYLGCSQPNWLADESTAPLFLALHRLRPYLVNEAWPRWPRVPWAMDSGGFNHVRKHGGWVMPVDDFVDRVWTHDRHIDGMVWAAPQDWMCEEDVLAVTGLTVREHQDRTTRNLLAVRAAWERLEDQATAWLGDEATPADRRPCPFIPVLQGWTEDDYVRHVDDYAAAGVDLAREPLVGLGSVCKRQATMPVVRIVERLALEAGLSLHGFGVKTDGLRAYGELLTSADSHAWSVDGRYDVGLCPHGQVKWEANCRVGALEWRDKVLATLPAGPRPPRLRMSQMRLF